MSAPQVERVTPEVWAVFAGVECLAAVVVRSGRAGAWEVLIARSTGTTAPGTPEPVAACRDRQDADTLAALTATAVALGVR
jgi:hypothetical protein